MLLETRSAPVEIVPTRLEGHGVQYAILSHFVYV